MDNIAKIRREYDNNYREMRNIIRQMGGDGTIGLHRRRQSDLYQRLRELQRREHFLDSQETRLKRQAALTN